MLHHNLLFQFSPDKTNSTITVKREFAANVDLVWEAWTRPEILDQWWAPKPYRTQTKTMNFKVDGFWLYAMISPENQKHWCRADYKKIEVKKFYSALDAFCDEQGTINTDFPRSLWSNTFIQQGDHTLVSITIQYATLADLEKIIELGFKEGFTMALGNLDQYIEEKFKR